MEIDNIFQEMSLFLKSVDEALSKPEKECTDDEKESLVGRHFPDKDVVPHLLKMIEWI